MGSSIDRTVIAEMILIKLLLLIEIVMPGAVTMAAFVQDRKTVMTIKKRKDAVNLINKCSEFLCYAYVTNQQGSGPLIP
jgi:hypothetical protein